jgi:hypothetical protein
MPATITTTPTLGAGQSVAPVSTTPRRLTAIVAAAAAATAIWAIATASGMSLHQPAAGSGVAPKLSVGMVIAVPIIAALAGWGVSRLVKRAWWAVVSVALLLSLAGPLSGHGVSAGNRAVLVCMHLAVGVIVGYGMRPSRSR